MAGGDRKRTYKKRSKEKDYDSDQFITHDMDEKNRSVTTQVRFMPRVLAMCQQIVQQRKFPFNTIQDIIRAGVDRELKYLSTLDSSVVSDVSQLFVLKNHLTEIQKRIEFVQLLESIEHQIKDLLQMGADVEATRLISFIDVEVKKMPEGFWREECLRRIMPIYNDLAQRFPILGLNVL